MTSKKKRQRGSRTHGGGSQKNRRGAGGRGGRGDAGRDKHEQHLHEPLGKSGFTRPESVERDVRTVDLRELDEDAPLLAADGPAEETDDGFRIDARDVVEDGHAADAVKVLGTGQVRRTLTVVADAFSDGAAERIEDAGGTAALSDRATDDGDDDPDDAAAE
jgi:large subunit ribosomal protein L15